jgi:RimJ/RimL family protein N-acetyltransferase
MEWSRSNRVSEPGPLAERRVYLERPAHWELGELVFKIRTLSGQEIGEIGFRNLNRRLAQAELGIELYLPFRGQGFGPEAITLLLDELFDNYQLERVFLRVLKANAQAQRAYAKAGFRYVRTVRWPMIGIVRYLVMEVTRGEHHARQVPG